VANEDETACQEQTPEAQARPTFAPRTTAASTAAPTTVSGQTTTTATTVAGQTTTTTVPAPASRNVIAIGDSVMLGASERLRETFPGAFVDATVSRAPVNGVARIEEIAAQGGLANVDVVVVHLGTNGNWGTDDFDRLMRSLEPIPLVVVVNARMPRSWESTVNAYLAEQVKDYSNVALLDWHKLGNSPRAAEEDWFADDGFHLNSAGRKAYADAVLAVVVGRGR
jgi:lysophospholipase L1-like esterase